MNILFKLFKLFVIALVILTIPACSSQKEDKIITDLNEVFDPDNTDDTDWNYTEFDGDLMTEYGLYYDSSINAYRQKYEYINESQDNNPMNPISCYLIILGILFITMEGCLLYATYLQSKKLNRIIWIWIVNSIFCGIVSFVILSLSPALKYDADLGFRKESDLLGIVLLMSNIFAIFAFGIIIMISMNPHVLEEFLRLG